MVIALAGRRVDAPGAAQSRFPAKNVGLVRDRIANLLKLQQAKTLVCSAACGADLIALAAAGDLGIRRIVVLPYSRDVFLRTSVIDRPGDWGESYDRVMDEVEGKNDVVVLGYAENDDAAYSATNLAILEQAEKVARKENLPIAAVVVWDGKSRGEGDFTEQFKEEAKRRGINPTEIPTLN
ncbi:MAG TPA: hypothetical protein VI685_00290 [Candidatus Angelobacter sp.]